MSDELGAAAEDKAGISGTVHLYRKPEPLSLERHANLGIMRTGEHLSFARKANFVPIVGGEFVAAAANYPIIFAGDKHTPLAVMGLREGENAFIRANGSMVPHVYAPSYLRRYPFVLATRPEGAPIICIDRAHETIQENADIPFFENGQPTPFVREAISFLETFEQQRALTEQMVEELNALGLFEPMSSQYTPATADRTTAQPIPLAQFIGISEEKLRALPADKLKELQDKGYLPLIYAHMFSLNNWSGLITRSIEMGYLPSGEAPPAQTN
jgi:hypothetical protein